jgi:type I restriction enzyme S subunit
MSWKIKTLEELFEKGSSKLTLKAVKDCVGPFKVFGAKGLCGHSDQYDQEQQYFAVIKDGAGVGRISCHEPQSSVLGTMQYLIPRGHENFRFLHYALLNLKLSSFAVGSTIPHIYFKDYKGLNVGVPTLEEQERIVEVLDEAFAAIDKAKANIERNLTNARELFQSRLNDIFSNPSKDWELKPLGETCDIVGRIGFRGYTRNDLVEEGNGAISMSPSNIQGQKLHFGKCTFLSWDKYHESPEIMVREGDVVFCKTGSTYGKCAFVDSLPIETTLNPQLVVFKNIKAEAEFIFYACTSPFFQNQIENMVGGTATPTISQKKIGACLVPTPSIQEQRKLVEHLQKVRTHVEKLEADYQTELDNLEELRQSILEQAFEGKLTETVAA